MSIIIIKKLFTLRNTIKLTLIVCKQGRLVKNKQRRRIDTDTGN